jgi:hypothetical protein
MAQTATSLFRQPQNHVEIVVHVDESLGADERNELVQHLVSIDGIEAAEFCPLRWHLMLVQYDRELINSHDVLGRVHAYNIHAELIGPV